MAVKFEATGDFSDLIAENQRYQKQVASLTEQLHEMTGVADPMGKAGVKAFRDLQRAAEQARKSIETPTDALNQQIARLDQALKGKLLSPREHAEAVEKLRQKYADTTTAAQRYQDAVVQLDRKLADGKTSAEDHAQAVMRLSTEFDKAATPADRYELAVAELTKEFNEGKLSANQYDEALAEQKRTLDLASDATEKHAGAVDKATDAGRKHGEQVGGLGSKIMTAVASYLTFDAILGQVKQALQFVNEEIDKAKASLKGLQPAESQLAQIAKDADDLAQMSNEADRMAGAYGVKREETRAAIVEGRNLDIESKQLESMVKYSDVAATSAQTLLGGKMQAIFGKENVSAEEAVSMGLVAAGASASNFEEMSRGIPSAAEGGRLAGASAEETLSIYSVFAGQFGTAATGADRIKALAGKLSKFQPAAGKGFVGGVEEIERFAAESPEKYAAKQAKIAELTAEMEATEDKEHRKKLQTTLAGETKALSKMAPTREAFLFGGEGSIFGSDTESRVAFETLTKQFDTVKAMTAKITAEKQTMRGGGESFIAAQYAGKYDESRAKTDEGKAYVRTQQALEENRQNEIELEIANERQLGLQGVQRESAIAGERARQKKEGVAPLLQYGGVVGGWAAEQVGADAETSRKAVRAGTAAAPGVIGPAGLLWNLASAAKARSDQGYRENDITGQAATAMRNAFVQTNTAPEWRAQVSEQLKSGYKEGGAEEYIRRGESAVQTRIQQVQSAGGPDQAEQIKILQASLQEMQKLTQLLSRNANATEDLRDASRTLPRPGASAAAAVPSGQRLGR